MIKQAFAKNYMPSGGGGNYKYYKINDPFIFEILDSVGIPIIDAIIEGTLYPIIVAFENNRSNQISALRTDNSYHYPIDVSSITGEPDSYASITGDIIKLLKLIIELSPALPSKEEQDEAFSTFQEISKGEYEAMIKK